MNIQKLLDASSNGNLEKVSDLISSGIDVNSKNEVGYTALMAAVRSYRIEVASYLISNGADVNASSNDSLKVLHHAVGETPSIPEYQNACVHTLLEHEAKIDAVSETGMTPLMWAVWFNCTESV